MSTLGLMTDSTRLRLVCNDPHEMHAVTLIARAVVGHAPPAGWSMQQVEWVLLDAWNASLDEQRNDFGPAFDRAANDSLQRRQISDVRSFQRLFTGCAIARMRLKKPPTRRLRSLTLEARPDGLTATAVTSIQYQRDEDPA